MKMFLKRLLPWLLGALAFGLASWQWQFPLTYPYPLALFFFSFVAAAVWLGWGRISWVQGVEKLAPSVLTLVAVGCAFLMAETAPERWMLSLVATAMVTLVLELFFLLTHDPANYPVHGLSHVNIALVPVAAFFTAVTLNGLTTFVHASRWFPLAVFLFLGAFLYLATAHPTANRAHRHRWAWLGALVGLHVGLLTLFLPVAMAVHGTLAAFLFAFPLRVRRYAYHPTPSAGIAWSESIFGVIAFVAVLAMARWV